MSHLRFDPKVVCGCWALLLAPALWAQETNPSVGVVNDLDDQKAVMQAQIEIMRKELDLNSTLKSLAMSVYQPLPSVLSLSIRGSQAQVRLLFASGVSANYKTGDLVPGGFKISEIKEREVFVEIRRNSKAVRVALEFAISPASPSLSPSFVSAGVGAIIPPELMPKLPHVPMPAVSAPRALPSLGAKP